VQIVYLDNSSVAKRYVHEDGSEIARLQDARTENGTERIVLSLWNIGEVLGVLDSYCSRNLLDKETLLKTIGSFPSESEKMIPLGGMNILPVVLNSLRKPMSKNSSPSRRPKT